MEDKDTLKETLGKLGNVHPPLDLEQSIMLKVAHQVQLKQKVRRYKRFGMIGIAVSLGLAIFYLYGFNFVGSLSLFSNVNVQIGFTSLGLLLLWMEWELGAKAIRPLVSKLLG